MTPTTQMWGVKIPEGRRGSRRPPPWGCPIRWRLGREPWEGASGGRSQVLGVPSWGSLPQAPGGGWGEDTPGGSSRAVVKQLCDRIKASPQGPVNYSGELKAVTRALFHVARTRRRHSSQSRRENRRRPPGAPSSPRISVTIVSRYLRKAGRREMAFPVPSLVFGRRRYFQLSENHVCSKPLIPDV